MTTLVPSFLNESSSFLQITRTTLKARMSLNPGKIPSLTSEIAALEVNHKSLDVTTLVLSNLDTSYSLLQIRMTTIKARKSLNFVKIPSPIKELAALEHLKNGWIM